MCGFLLRVDKKGDRSSSNQFHSAIESLKHRGPDDDGVYTHRNVGIAHTRLSIIDLSYNACQPFEDENSNWVIAYNGEIYNYKSLRTNLKEQGYDFRSTSDTEVLLKGWREWGSSLFERLNGMYSFALYNSNTRQLLTARDEFGIKPLYRYETNEQLIFASEQKAIMSMLDTSPELDPEGLNEYLAFQNFLSDRTLLKNFRTMDPGNLLEYDTENHQLIRETEFDQFQFDNSFDGTREQAIEALKASLYEAVEAHMISDVPVHAYLSGGMDSSTIAAVASDLSEDQLKTFTVGFENGVNCDEREPARIVANAIRSDHYEDVVNPDTLPEVLDDLIWHLEEPRVGHSYPNYVAARLAAQHGKVVLSGAGGDELFGGYPWRYQMTWGEENHSVNRDRMYSYWERLYNSSERKDLINSDFHSSMDFDRPRQIFTDWVDSLPYDLSTQSGFLNGFFHVETNFFLRGLFHVEDKLGMAFGLEERFPFLDRDLVDLATSIPPRWKVDPFDGTQQFGEHRQLDNGKKVLRDAMKKLLPKKIQERNKQGFSGPYERWQNEEQSEFIQRIISNNCLLDIENGSCLKYNDIQGWGLISVSSFYDEFGLA
jgi:asparagine synthase (glutamine-hydrolysing)